MRALQTAYPALLLPNHSLFSRLRIAHALLPAKPLLPGRITGAVNLISRWNHIVTCSHAYYAAVTWLVSP